MNVLALEPYYGGSHKAFLDGWIHHSKHSWTVLSLPPFKWKWRMRHSAITFAQMLNEMHEENQFWDVLFFSDMLNFAEFKGLVDERIRQLPSIAYFHENQLSYPVRYENERDYHFATTNLTTALCADHVWFNSRFHRDEFLESLNRFLRKMPDYQPLESIEIIRSKSSVFPQGVEPVTISDNRPSGPAVITWAARWEFDKDPDTFFEALRSVKKSGIDFRLNVIGEQFSNSPEVFRIAEQEFADHIDRWGYQESREEYLKTLSGTDIFVSTAQHEFFGVSVVEAIAAGAYPLLPLRLAYPEIIPADEADNKHEFFYDGDAESLGEKLKVLAEKINSRGRDKVWGGKSDKCIKYIKKFFWNNLTPHLDSALENSVV